ncbi:hypothetical protein DFH09DRAFT_1369510 [Mycena vulgaris]|nr:hypothetical protein DFH09DRAFT_1369510 [Mycena vulgaris]
MGSNGPVIPALSAEIWDSLIPIDADAEADPIPTTTLTAPSTPAAQPAYTHYQPYGGHYAQHQPQQAQVYAGYQYVQQQQHQHQQAQAQPVSMARQALVNAHSSSGGFGGGGGGGGGGAGALDTSDVATLNDALGSAGVDLRAEEERLQRASSQPPQPFRPALADRARAQPARPHVDATLLGARMRTKALGHGGLGVPEECVTYLALALRARLEEVVRGMARAARHRVRGEGRPAVYEGPGYDYDEQGLDQGDGQGLGEGQDGAGRGGAAKSKAAWGMLVRRDVARQLAALERAERAEELRARRTRAAERAIAAVLAGEEPGEIPGEEEIPAPRTGRGEGMQGVEQTERKARYTWLTAGGRPYKVARRAPPENGDGRVVVGIRDALFAVEKERGHGGGRGAARGWT